MLKILPKHSAKSHSSKPHKIKTLTAGKPAEVQNEYLPKPNAEHYCYNNLISILKS
jgi:hypothetical protein